MRRAIVPLPDGMGRRMGFSGRNGVRGTLLWADWLDHRIADIRTAA